MASTKPLQRAVLWSQTRPRRKASVYFDDDRSGDLVIWFEGLGPSHPSSSDHQWFHRIACAWIPAFLRRYGLTASDPIRGLRTQITNEDAARRLQASLWRTAWVGIPGRAECQWHQADVRLASVPTPTYPGRRPARQLRSNMLRRELQRSLGEDMGGFLWNVQNAYHAAVAQVAKLPRPRLTPEVCQWAFPELEFDHSWSQQYVEWNEGDELPQPNDEKALRLARVESGPSIYRGVEMGSFTIGSVDYWFGDGNNAYGPRPATSAGRLTALKEMAEHLGGPVSGFELLGVDPRLEQRFQDWSRIRWRG